MTSTLLPIIDPEFQLSRKLRREYCRTNIYRRRLLLNAWVNDPRCRYCGKPLRFPWQGVMDHALPRSRGGGNTAANLVLSCRPCDRAKGDRTIAEWRADLAANLFALPLRESGL